MTLHLIAANLDHYDALYNLCQLYQYDFSEFLPGEVDQNGEFTDIDVRRYIADKGHKAYLARTTGTWCGFVLINDRLRHRTNGGGRYIAEFFVMRRYRRQGIGRDMAFKAFNTFRGYWEIAEVGPNVPAQAFWRRIIGEYTTDRFTETTTEEDGFPIIWQTFDSSTW